MSPENSRSTSATGSSGCSDSSGTNPSASAMPPANASSNNVYDHRLFIESLVVAISQEQKQLPLLGIMGAPVFGGVQVTKCIET